MQRRLIVLLLAVVLAGFSGLAVLAYGKGADHRALAGTQGRWVLLATGTIPAGTTVTEIRGRKLARQVLMPARTVPDGALTKLDDLAGTQQLNAMLLPDQMLLSGQFEPGAAPSPSSTFKIPSGKVAVSVDLDIARQVAGNVDPGDQVTIFETTPKVGTKDEPQTTTMLLDKVTVISVGESPQVLPTATPSASGSAQTGLTATTAPTSNAAQYSGLQRYVVTFAVSASQAEKLVNAYNSGLLHLGLLPGASPTPSPSLMPTPGETP